MEHNSHKPTLCWSELFSQSTSSVGYHRAMRACTKGTCNLHNEEAEVKQFCAKILPPEAIQWNSYWLYFVVHVGVEQVYVWNELNIVSPIIGGHQWNLSSCLLDYLLIYLIHHSLYGWKPFKFSATHTIPYIYFTIYLSS